MTTEELNILKSFAVWRELDPAMIDKLMPVIEMARTLERLACERVVHDQAQGEPCCKLEAARLSKVISRRE